MSYTTNAREMTRAYFDSLMLEERLVDAVVPDLSTTLFGETFSTPITTTALSHLKKFNPGFEKPMEAYAGGAAMANTMHWIGMCESEEFRNVMACGAKTVRFVKPYADKDKIFFQLKEAEAAGAIAVGIDIDHTFDGKGNP
ncbi:MAG: alpha-hydroxy-acid oxidizing protein, partial [Clostridiales bacterium]|nr:alpha-hydroxy-acid oxidizing protein [Candidatus Blautia equi]